MVASSGHGNEATRQVRAASSRVRCNRRDHHSGDVWRCGDALTHGTANGAVTRAQGHLSLTSALGALSRLKNVASRKVVIAAGTVEREGGERDEPPSLANTRSASRLAAHMVYGAGLRLSVRKTGGTGTLFLVDRGSLPS